MLIVLATLGILISIYALYVEKHANAKDYRAFCDVHDNISCTRSLTSKESRTFGWHNATYGLIFYALIIVLTYTYAQFIFPLALISVLYSAYLAYVQYVKQKNFCLVCTLSYLINLGILALS
ncbi:MAG: hypothetical protein OXR66_02115 [Candidatus Woesearchaeota archaeon]|nr:hypothetical protein [Candidatus Woesearchaeota archaeon]